MKNYPIVHIEFVSNNPKATGEFMKEVFGWEIETDPNFDYVMFKPQAGPPGGVPGADQKMYQAGETLVYMGTEDIDATLAEIESCGGKTVVPKTEIPNTGWFAIFEDPAGCKMALFSRQTQP